MPNCTYKVFLCLLLAGCAFVADAEMALEEIIVTGERREQNIQDVASSLSVIGNEEIMRLGIDDFQGYSRSQAGVVMHQPVRNRSTWNIRGINTDIGDTQLTQEPVSVYIDDMPVSQPYASLAQVDLRLYDVNRVEVLRGPQGTLFGSGALGGLVRVLTNDPRIGEHDASVRLDLADISDAGMRARVDGMINLPVTDNLAIRAVGYKRDEAGWVENDVLGTENSVDDWGGRVAALWQPNDKFSAMFKFMHQKSDPEDGDAWNPDLGKFKRDVVVTEQRKTEFTQYNMTLKYQIDGLGELISSTNYQETDANWLLQAGEIPGIGKLLNQTDPYESEWFIQEVRLVSETGAQFDWVVGAIYSEVENSGEFRFVLDGLQNFVEAIAGPGIVANDDFFAGPARMNSTEYAAYGNVTWHLNDEWHLSGGLRAFYFESDFVDGGSYLFDFDTFGPLQIPGFTNKADDNDVTWRTTLSYQPSVDRHYYVNVSRGYRVGQINPNFGPSFVDPTDVVIAESYDPDESINYEIGLKASLLDDRLQLNLAAYYIDWTDAQVDALRPSDQRNYIANAGDVVSKGFEVEAVYLATESLDLRLTAGWQDAEVDQIDAANTFLSGAQDGDTMPGTPDFVGSIQANYFRPIKNEMELHAYVSIQYVDESPNRFSLQAATGLPHPDFAINDSYVNVDAGLGVTSDKWGVTIYAENLANNDDIILDTGAVATATGENNYITLRPRTLGARVELFF